jgi:glutathione S-transferase
VLRLYDYPPSGNCYKIRLLLSQLNLAFERVEIDILGGDAGSAEFTKKNALQKVPVLEWPDGRILTESNAILFYCADGSDFLPDDGWLRAQILQWQSFEQFSLVPYIGTVRFWYMTQTVDRNRDNLEHQMERGYRALRIVEAHLSDKDFFVGDRYTIADISLYSYTHLAAEVGFVLDSFENLCAWVNRVKNQPRHVPITG